MAQSLAAVRPQAPVTSPPTAVASTVDRMPTKAAEKGDADKSDGERGVAAGPADLPPDAEDLEPSEEFEVVGRTSARKSRDVIPGGPRSETSSPTQPVAHGGRVGEDVKHGPDGKTSPGSAPRIAVDEKVNATKSRPLGGLSLGVDEPDDDARPEESEIQRGSAAPDSVRTRAARADEQTLPIYPRRARRIGAEGTTELEVFVNESGVPTRARVIHSSGRLDMDDAAKQAVMQWRFSPARKGEEFVPSSVEVTIEFRLSD